MLRQRNVLSELYNLFYFFKLNRFSFNLPLKSDDLFQLKLVCVTQQIGVLQMSHAHDKNYGAQ